MGFWSSTRNLLRSTLRSNSSGFSSIERIPTGHAAGAALRSASGSFPGAIFFMPTKAEVNQIDQMLWLTVFASSGTVS